MAWKKGSRNGVVVQGAGGPHSGSNPGGGTVRIGGRVPWDAEVEFAYTTGYDSRGRVSVNHLVLGQTGIVRRYLGQAGMLM